MAGRPQHWVAAADRREWYPHVEWCIDDSRDNHLALRADHVALMQAHQALEQAHHALDQQAKQAHQALMHAHARLEQAHALLDQQFVDRNKASDGILARLLRLEDAQQDSEPQGAAVLGPAVRSVGNHSSSSGSCRPAPPAPAPSGVPSAATPAPAPSGVDGAKGDKGNGKGKGGEVDPAVRAVQHQRHQEWLRAAGSGGNHSSSSGSSGPAPAPAAPGAGTPIPPERWCRRNNLSEKIMHLDPACHHSKRFFVLESPEHFPPDDYASAADAGTDADKLWNQCTGLGTCFDFGYNQLYDCLESRPDLFMKFHNPSKGSSAYSVVFGCRACGRHTPEFQPQYEKRSTAHPKDSEKVKCAFREIISCILTDDIEETVFNPELCTHRAPYCVVIRTRRPHEVFPPLAITMASV